jgi:tetratricopeptide (TPR) repeat protein
MLALIVGGLVGLIAWLTRLPGPGGAALSANGRLLTQLALALALALMGAGALGLVVGRLRRGRGLGANGRAGAARQVAGIIGLLALGLAAAVWPVTGLWGWVATLATLACGLGALWLGLRLAQSGTPAELRQARHAYGLGQWEEAAQLLESVLRARPDLESARQLAAQVSRHKGDLAGALRHAEALAEMLPDGYYGHAELGLTLLEMAKPQRAIAPLRRAAEIAPNLAEAHFNLGLAMVESHQQEPAIAALTRALRLGLPDEVTRLIARYHLFVALRASGQAERAAAELRLLRRQAGTLRRWRQAAAEGQVSADERRLVTALQQRIEQALKLSTD